MALDITEIKLTKKQEKEVLAAARARGRIMLSLDGDEASFSEDPKAGGADIEFSSAYYEGVFRFLAQRGIVPSPELQKKAERIVAEEKAFEDSEYFLAVKKIDDATRQASKKLEAEITKHLAADISPKLKNDYRAVLRHLEKGDVKADYIEKWTGRLLGAEALAALTKKIGAVKEKFGDAVLIHRLYTRLFLYEPDVQPGKRLRWIRLIRP